MPGLSNAVQHWELFDHFMPNSNRWLGCTLGMYADYLNTAHKLAHAANPDVVILNSAFI